MALIVQKFGGSSVANRERIFHVARIIAQAHSGGDRVVAVVSAQGDTTDELLEKAAQITPRPDGRELDVLLSVGEQISIALLCMEPVTEALKNAFKLSPSVWTTSLALLSVHLQAQIKEGKK